MDRSGSSGRVRAPFLHRYSRSSAGIREGVGLMNRGSSKLGKPPSETLWGKEEAVEELVEREFVSDGTEPCEEANDARRRL